MKRLFAGIAALLAACSTSDQPTKPVADQATERRIAQGDIIGFIEQNGAHVWRGLPYAASTAGDNRWRAPRPAPSWSDPRPALEFSKRCPQIMNPFHVDLDEPNGTVLGSEDCLKLDVYAPPNANGRDLPVMVWIHGGSNVSGASYYYQGHKLAVNENVIIVSIQYRLGALGWFAHPQLNEEADDPRDQTANFGTLDMIAALEWVKQNASAFGGDPDNVTIFGESAGGHNVVTLLASPLAEGLYHKAIIQSGLFDSLPYTEATGEEGDQVNSPAKVLAKLGATDPNELRSLSLEGLFAGYDISEYGYYDLPRVIQDGVAIPTTPLREAFSNTSTFADVPIITGVTRDEMKLFHLFNPELVKRYPFGLMAARDQDFYDAGAEYASRVWRIRSVDGPAAMMRKAGHDDVYAYRFDWDEGGKFLFMDTSKLLGAAHSLEIPFVLNRYILLGEADRLLFTKKNQKTREQLSRAMGAYWAAFARDGVPAAPGQIGWPVYGDTEQLIRFDTVTDGGITLMAGQDSVAKIGEDIRKDLRLSEEQRCQIIVGLVGWLPDLADPLATESACDFPS